MIQLRLSTKVGNTVLHKGVHLLPRPTFRTQWHSLFDRSSLLRWSEDLAMRHEHPRLEDPTPDLDKSTIRFLNKDQKGVFDFLASFARLLHMSSCAIVRSFSSQRIL